MLLKGLIVFLVSQVSLVNADHSNFIYKADSKAKLVYVSIDDSSSSLEKSNLNCSIISDPDAVDKILSSTFNPIIPIDNGSFDTLIKSCNASKSTPILSNDPLPTVESTNESDLLIAPGTKWCGPGNRAKNYDDLGEKVETDKCCRTHDLCPKSIEGFATKYGLTNRQGYTSSLCDCDQKLKTCLKNASETEPEANLIGAIYFNVLRSMCFQQVKPEGQCLQYSGLLIKRCEKRADPKASEPVYQFKSSGLYI